MQGASPMLLTVVGDAVVALGNALAFCAALALVGGWLLKPGAEVRE